MKQSYPSSRKHLLAVLLPLVSGLAAVRAAAATVLIDNGRANTVIVVAHDALAALSGLGDAKANPVLPADKVAWAARDLQEYLQKISGAKVPIVSEDVALPAATHILVGRSKLTGKYDAKIPSGLTNLRKEEGYAILTDGPDLVLAGNDQGGYHGTEYAVSFFLNRLGVRWYMPGEFGEVVPHQATVSVDNIAEISHPDFRMRNWWTSWMAGDLVSTEVRWKIHNGMNIDAMIAIPGDSSVRNVLPPESEKDNPAYADVFARDMTGKVYPYMPNLSSEKSVQYAANVIKTYFRAHPEATSYGIGADDGLPRDFSPGTQAIHLNFPSMLGLFNDAAGGSTTEEWMLWVQRVAAEVYKEFPDHFLTTNGYANRDSPPIGIKPDPKVWIMFAAIWSDNYHAYDNPKSWMTQRQYNMLKDWTGMYSNVYMYDYLYYNLVGGGAPPIPLARRHMHNMPILKRLGVVGFSDEGRTVRGESGVFPTYLLARMMWNADLDGNALMTEFYHNWYGPAAVPAQAFWDEMESTIENSIWAGNTDHLLSLDYTPELIARLETHLKEAEALAKGDAWAAPRVLADRVIFDHLVAYKAMERAEAEANFPEAAHQAQRMLDIRKPATALSRFYWDPATTAHPQVGEAEGMYYWGAASRRDYYQQLADLTTGKTGDLVATLSEQAKFSLDPRDDGRFDGWYRVGYDDSKWKTALTTRPFFAQGDNPQGNIAPGANPQGASSADAIDAQGYPYMGALWYRLNVQVPALAKGRSVKLYCPVAETEAWVWVNGKLVGHRPYIDGYIRPNPIDMDVTDALVPGAKNSVVVRMQTNFMPGQMAGGLESRLFLYSPKPVAATAAAATAAAATTVAAK